MDTNVFDQFLSDSSAPATAPEIDLSDVEITPIRIGEGIRWADVARENGINILSERKLDSALSLYDPIEYRYISPHTGKTIWAYVRTLSGPDSDQDDGVYASRQLTNGEIEQAWRDASSGRL